MLDHPSAPIVIISAGENVTMGSLVSMSLNHHCSLLPFLPPRPLRLPRSLFLPPFPRPAFLSAADILQWSLLLRLPAVRGRKCAATLTGMWATAPSHPPIKVLRTCSFAIVRTRLIYTLMPPSIRRTMVSGAVAFMYLVIVMYACCRDVIYFSNVYI